MELIHPSLFLGHGNPLHALEPGPFGQAWQALAASLPPPRGIVVISAHWVESVAQVTAMERPRTIHDFGGFPRALYRIQYPCPGSPELAHRVADLLAPLEVQDNQDWGLDHGAWSLLVHLYPRADIPVVQLSLDRNRPSAHHLELGRRLAPLRREGVLILGSGNIVHHLGMVQWEATAPPYDWALRFDERVRDRIMDDDNAALLELATTDPDARRALPTPEHFVPLLYVLGTRTPGESVQFPVTGIELGSISMTGVLLTGRT